MGMTAAGFCYHRTVLNSILIWVYGMPTLFAYFTNFVKHFDEVNSAISSLVILIMFYLTLA